MFTLLKFLLGIIVLLVAAGFLQTWQVNTSENGKLFASSSAPKVALNGFYKGGVNLPVKITWLGKKFIAASSTGINIFDDGDPQPDERYPFTTSVASSSGKTVLLLDYNLPENPLWLRPVLDEVVEPMPGQYMGKLTVRIVPGYPFALGFFRLTK